MRRVAELKNLVERLKANIEEGVGNAEALRIELRQTRVTLKKLEEQE